MTAQANPDAQAATNGGRPMTRAEMYCNDACRQSRREDRRAGLVGGFDRFTAEMAAERTCLYCRWYVPTNAERRAAMAGCADCGEAPAARADGTPRFPWLHRYGATLHPFTIAHTCDDTAYPAAAMPDECTCEDTHR